MFLSMEAVFPSSRNVFLNEFSIPASENPLSLQTHHVYSTLKRRGNGLFHIVSTWNTRGVFVEFCLVKTVFFYLEISFLVVETGKSYLWKTTIFLLVENDFLASGNHFFLLLSDTLVTCSHIFSSSGKVFLKESYIPVSGNGFSG